MTEQPELATYEAYVLRYPDGSWLAELTDFPGAYATGATQAEALERLAAAVPGYYAWLSEHDEYTPITHSIAQVTAREVVEAPRLSVAGLGAFFADDAKPVTNEDMDWWLAALDWAFGDLERQAQRASGARLRDSLLAAVAQAQSRIVALATGAPLRPAGAATDALGFLKATHAAALASFRGTNTEQRAAVREEAGQRWSVRRGLRESALLVRRSTDELAAMQG
jgi:predicted RNase H-like HicB family nuclease